MGTKVTDNSTAYALAWQMKDGQRAVLLVSKIAQPRVFDITAFAHGWTGAVLEGVGLEPGFVPPREVMVEEGIVIGPYGVALMWQPSEPSLTYVTGDAIV